MVVLDLLNTLEDEPLCCDELIFKVLRGHKQILVGGTCLALSDWLSC